MPPPQPAATASTAAKSDRAALPKAARCFIALWPDAQARDQLDALARQLQKEHSGSRRMHPDNLHLTLAFIGPLEEEAARRVAQMLLAVDVAPFCWTLDLYGGFARARVLWAGDQGEPQLATLAHKVRQGLDDLMVAYDRKPFSPHVTLLRDVAHPPAANKCTPILWHVTGPQLMVSERNANGELRYRPWAECAIP